MPQTKVNELKGLIYDEILKHKAAERNIAILEQQLQAEIQKDAQPVAPVADAPKVSEAVETPPHNNA